MQRLALTALAVLSMSLLAACGTEPQATRSPAASAAHSAAPSVLAEGEDLQVTGTEPFWGGTLAGGRLTYTTPEHPKGTVIPVSRFDGLNGAGFSGELGGQPFDMAVSSGPCSDGMSDRAYPYVVTLKFAGELRNGCGWSARRPFTGPRNP